VGRRSKARQPSSSAAAIPNRDAATSPRAGLGSAGAGRVPPKTWMQTHGRDLRFLGIFGALMLVYFFFITTSFSKDDFFPWYLRGTTQVSGSVLHATGYSSVSVEGQSLVSTRGAITVERGCDALDPTALFLSAVVASPAAMSLKIPGLIGGTLILMVVNVIRIVTLFLTRVHWSSAFDVMHLDIWQVAFILFAIVLWAGWASWAKNRTVARVHVSS